MITTLYWITNIKFSFNNKYKMTFIPKEGFLTQIMKNEYIKYLREKGELIDTCVDKSVLSLYSHDNTSSNLYFWQLYSILGEKPILELITNFYTRIFNDNEKPWFRDFFKDLGSLEYHIKGQTNFWLDTMGAGKYYQGGEKKLKFKHELTRELMTTTAANRWLYHMVLALKDTSNSFNQDPRIIPCLERFLLFFMNRYSLEFDFNFIDISTNKSNL